MNREKLIGKLSSVEMKAILALKKEGEKIAMLQHVGHKLLHEIQDAVDALEFPQVAFSLNRLSFLKGHIFFYNLNVVLRVEIDPLDPFKGGKVVAYQQVLSQGQDLSVETITPLAVESIFDVTEEGRAAMPSAFNPFGFLVRVIDALKKREMPITTFPRKIVRKTCLLCNPQTGNSRSTPHHQPHPEPVEVGE